MLVAVYYNNNDIRLEEFPVPEIGPGELLVKVRASGICGSDVMEWYRIRKAPLVLGHEVTGEIVRVGKGALYRIGDRIFVSHHVPCNECRYCLSGHHTACETMHSTNFDPGGFAEFIRIPKINVERGIYLLPDDLSFDDGTFIEPLGCVVRAQRLAKIKDGDTVLILGSGITGLLHIQLALLSGGKVIATDINEYRLEVARKLGAEVINATGDVQKRVYELNGRLADKVIVCTGAESASKQAFRCVDRGGTIVFFAVPEPGVDVSIPINEFWRREISVMTSYGASPQDLKVSLQLLAEKKVKVNHLITHRLSLAEIGIGFRLVAEAKESIKVIILPHG